VGLDYAYQVYHGVLLNIWDVFYREVESVHLTLILFCLTVYVVYVLDYFDFFAIEFKLKRATFVFLLRGKDL
jgi:hypothetical protein